MILIGIIKNYPKLLVKKSKSKQATSINQTLVSVSKSNNRQTFRKSDIDQIERFQHRATKLKI